MQKYIEKSLPNYLRSPHNLLMGINSKLTRLLLQEISRRKCHDFLQRTANYSRDPSPGAFHRRPYSKSRASLLEDVFEADVPEEGSSVCIYKIPANMRWVERKAYEPNVVSIGPYHYGVERLQDMEELKQKFVRRLFDRSRENEVVEFELVKDAMGKLEEEARICYGEEIKLGSEEFVETMVIDGCFVVELLREAWQHQLRGHPIPFIKRWMLPALRRDLIMLENQLPFFVLNKLFEMTSSTPAELPPSLQQLALHFFNPLLQRGLEAPPPKSSTATEVVFEARHLLDLFRSSTLPIELARGKQPNMIRSITELKQAGVKVQRAKHLKPLDITYEEGVLKIPPIYIDDYKGTVIRNMVAFEKCHHSCHPDVTAYLFFFDGLINSAKDVGLLYCDEVLHHSLGSNKEVAKLVNNICKEIDMDVDESYLFMVVDDANSFFGSPYGKARAGLVRHYFSSWVVGISTLGAVFAVYLTLIQTATGVAGARDPLKDVSFSSHLKDSLLLPFFGTK
ncbi:hypothetical protein I3760_09G075000 [Carya illinoinensis]|nr:hypothetical protein I3760_09G075000 [Carya illinoinensis]